MDNIRCQGCLGRIMMQKKGWEEALGAFQWIMGRETNNLGVQC